MKFTNKPLVAGLLAAFLSSSIYAETKADVEPNVSIMEIMMSIITPTSDVLWGANDPKTDAEWKTLEDAAITLIASGTLIDLGGTGPQDNTWVKDPIWRGFSRTMTDAGLQALKAIRNKDMDALFEAGDVLYPPCEGCHLQFNPGVSQSQ